MASRCANVDALEITFARDQGDKDCKCEGDQFQVDLPQSPNLRGGFLIPASLKFNLGSPAIQ
jgi:hypothetical protein